jgi:hypothetical protein
MKSKISLTILSTLLISCAGQMADSNFDSKVTNPAYTNQHPKVLFDEAHNNFHTASGRYKPLIDLITNDGYAVTPNKKKFEMKALREHNILIISNAMGSKSKYNPAFTEEECNTVRDWVQSGGSLLLIADHHPMGSAAEILSKKFNIVMTKGFTEDSLNYDKTGEDKGQLVFSRENKLLLNHPITEGRNFQEKINRIVTFTGQSLESTDDSFVFLKLGDTAVNYVPDSIWVKKEMWFFTKTYTRFTDAISASGQAQGIAMEFGKGRVVILGEAAMLTAQIANDKKFGMNVPGNDNKQLALNIMHWLSRAL